MPIDVNPKTESGGVRDLRRAAGLSQEALARRADCSISMVQLLERGYTPQRSVIAERIAAVLEAEKSNDAAENGVAAKNGQAGPHDSEG